LAFGKAQTAAGNLLPRTGVVFLSVNDRDKEGAVEITRQMRENGFRIVSTRGTARFLLERGIPVEQVNKVAEGRPHVVDMILNRKVDLVMNTTMGKPSVKDSRSIRRCALERNIPYFTTLPGSWAAAKAIAAALGGSVSVRTLQSLRGNRS
jgi:carbamoyl-phosphate synthase large subunit